MISEFLGDRSAWMCVPTVGLQGAVPLAQRVDRQVTPLALLADDGPSPLDAPGNGPHHHSSREDSLGQCFTLGGPEQPREGFGFDILKSWSVQKCEAKPAKKECLVGLTRI